MDSIDIRLRRLRAMAEASTYRAGAGAFTLGSDIFGVPVLERGVLHEVFAQEKGHRYGCGMRVAGLGRFMAAGWLRWGSILMRSSICRSKTTRMACAPHWKACVARDWRAS
jgi:hypothetical protein